MSKYDIWPQFECQNRLLNVKIRFSAPYECQNRNFYVKIRYQPQFICINRVLNVKMRYSPLRSNVKIGF